MASKPNWLIIRILKTKSKFFGTSTKHIQLTIYQLANVRNSIEHPFRNSMAGKDWIDRFLTRYRDEIVSLTPTDASAARTLGFDRENVNAFFLYILDQERDKYRYTPDRIQNAGEMGLLPLYSQKYQKLLVLRGKKANGQLNGSRTWCIDNSYALYESDRKLCATYDHFSKEKWE